MIEQISTSLIGRYVQWNENEQAEIVAVFAYPTTGVIGGIFRRPTGDLVEDALNRKKLVPITPRLKAGVTVPAFDSPPPAPAEPTAFQDFLKDVANRPPKLFKPKPCYHPDGDFLDVFFTDDEAYIETLTPEVEIYRAFSDPTKIVGCKFHGIRKLDIFPTRSAATKPGTEPQVSQVQRTMEKWITETELKRAHRLVQVFEEVLKSQQGLSPEMFREWAWAADYLAKHVAQCAAKTDNEPALVDLIRAEVPHTKK